MTPPGRLFLVLRLHSMLPLDFRNQDGMEIKMANANGHGGFRAGAGRKPKPKEPAANDNVVPMPSAVPAEPKQQSAVRPMFSRGAIEALLEASREIGNRSRNRPRTREWNPYVIRPDRFGVVAQHIHNNREARSRKLAMDDSTSLQQQNQFAIQAWQAGGFAPNDATEGMLFLGYPYLSELLQRAEFRLFGEITSEEMTRKWIDFRGTDDESTKEKDKPKDRNNDDREADDRRKQNGEKPRSDDWNKEIESKIIELREYCESINLRSWFKSISAQNEYFGIAHLYLDLKGANIQDLRDPENRMSIGNGRDETSKAKLGRNCLLGVRTIEPVWCYPTAYNSMNPLAPDWYDPIVWYVMGAEVHKTRLIPFISRPVPDILKPAYAFGGLSMTQMAQPYVDSWLRTRESVSELIHAFSVMVLMTDLGTTTMPGGAGGGGGDVIARILLANQLRDNQGMMVLNKATEEFKNISAPISGLDHLQAQAQEHMFACGRIPAVKWTGIQPTGLNATSEGEMRAFNDTIHGKQENDFRPGLTTVLDIAQISLWGARDPDITFDFNPLHELTEKEKAEARKMDAETAQIRIDSGIISQEEERSRLVADVDSGYHGLDPEDVPDLIEEEMAGLIPAGAGRGLEAELSQAAGPGKKPPPGGRKPGKQPSREEEPAEDGGIQNFDSAIDAGDVKTLLRADIREARKRDVLGYLRGMTEVTLIPDKDNWNAEYDEGRDAAVLQNKVLKLPARERVRILLHEGGHRAQFKVARKTFAAFKKAGLGTMENFTPIANAVHQRDIEKTGKVEDLAGEVFSESYARMAMGMDVPEELRAFWDNVRQNKL
jgi:hypothetical protein